MTSYFTNPFTGDINPADTNAGQKLYLKATSELKERLQISQANARDISAHFETDARNFAWGQVTNMIKTSDTDTNGKSMPTNSRDLTLENVQKAALKIWGNNTATYNTALPNAFTVQALNNIDNDANEKKTFFARVRSEMVAKRIENSITAASWKTLMLKKNEFTWKNTATGEVHIDGGTLMFILLTKINPTTRVGVSELKTDLREATSAKFKHNVKDLTDYLSSKYREITEKGQQHQDYLLDLFNALKTVPNADFASFVRDERQAWEIGG